MSKNNFSNTLIALKQLETHLSCMSCSTMMKKPISLFTCDHKFCEKCLKNVNKCPTCCLPVWSQDKHQDLTLTNIAQLYLNLNKAVLDHINKKVPAKDETGVTKQDLVTPIKRNIKRAAGNLTVGNSNFVTPLKNSHFDFQTPSPRIKRSKLVKTPRSASKNKRGETFLHIAAISGSVTDVDKLISEGADINAKDNAGWSSLHEACNRGYTRIVGKLIDAGAIIDIPGYENETPLMDAVSNNQLSTVKLLLAKGASTEIRNAQGKSALGFARTEEMKSLLNKFTKQNAESDLTGEELTPAEHCQADDIRLAYSSRLDGNKVKELAKILNARLSQSAVNVTHLIVKEIDKKCNRTLKYLQAAACGAIVIHEGWMESCLENKTWVNELKYQVTGSIEDSILGGPQRSYIAVTKHSPRLFNGCHFFFHGQFNSPMPSKQQLSEIVKLADGVVLTREPKPDSDCIQSSTMVPYYAKANTPQYYFTYYIVYDPSQKHSPRIVRRGKVCTVTVSWLLDCISQFKICESL